MAPPDDEPKWIQDSLAGDTEPYAALVKEHQKMVHAMAFRMTGSLADAEDLTQETFLRAFWSAPVLWRFGKAGGTCMATQRQCDRIAEQLNKRPRLRLGFKTPNEVYY
jgi:DNA-directed RNA polymerase specialized sigma24 family protein